MVRPKHEWERGCAVLVEHIYVFFLSLYILEINVAFNILEISVAFNVRQFVPEWLNL